MLIGIDESGSFSLEDVQTCGFVGVHILDQSAHDRLADLLQRWKDRNRSLKSGRGEIKGADLTEEAADAFVEDVIKPMEWLYITVYRFSPGEHKKIHIQTRRDLHIQDLEGIIQKCRLIGNYSLADQYVQLVGWYRKLSYQLLIKSWVLSFAIWHSFREHVIQTILSNADLTLGKVQLSIDRDHITKPNPTMYWEELLRSWLYSYSFHDPVPVIQEWGPDHPFRVAWGDSKNIKPGLDVFVDNEGWFKRCVSFVDSSESMLVQVADISASIVLKGLESRGFTTAYKGISSRLIPIRRPPIINVDLATIKRSGPEQLPNPWQYLRSG